MRIDPKYFNLFMAVVAVVALVVILFGTFRYIENQQNIFRETVVARQDSLATVGFPRLFEDDTLRIDSISSRFVLLDFWATWSDRSSRYHRDLQPVLAARGDTLTVIAAMVKDSGEKARQYREEHGYPFEYVDGTELYNELNVPGLPAQILFDPQKKVLATFVGYRDTAQIDSLQALIEHE